MVGEVVSLATVFQLSPAIARDDLGATLAVKRPLNSESPLSTPWLQLIVTEPMDSWYVARDHTL